MNRTIVFDTMGVIDTSSDDIKDLLYPFIRSKGVEREYEDVRQIYRRASLGLMTAARFWTSLGIDPRHEVEYIRMHKMTMGMKKVLNELLAKRYQIWCLSNDLHEWSEMRMAHFGIREYFAGLTVSGTVGCRKPDAEIYRKLIEATGATPAEMLFIDDRPANLETAKQMGINAILFTANTGGLVNPEWDCAGDCTSLLRKIRTWTAA